MFLQEVLDPRCGIGGGGPLIGTRVTVTAGGRSRSRDVASGDSYQSSHDPRAHFGLGDADRVRQLVVRYPDGSETRLRDVAADRLVTVGP